MTQPIGPHETVPYSVYADALRAADRDFATERDRRYAEVNVEKEKALKIKVSNLGDSHSPPNALRD